MAISQRPVVGDWYLTATGDTVEVVAYDTEAQTIELQHFDGTVEELDLETWLELGVEPAEAPDDFTGSLDMAREDDGDSRARRRSVSPLDDPDLY